MTRRRWENLDPDKLQKLFESAAEEFGKKGYEAASLNQILSRSGMSKSSLYYYFDDKADLATTMIEKAMSFLFREVGGLDIENLTAENYWKEMETLCCHMIAVMDKSTWYIKLGRMFYLLRGNPKEGGFATGRAFKAARLWISGILKRGQELNVVRSDLPESLLVDISMGVGETLDRWMLAHWEDFDKQSRLDITRAQVDLFRRLLSAKP